MTYLEKMEAQFKFGQVILEQFNALTDLEIKAKLATISPSTFKQYDHLLEPHSQVNRKIVNMVISEISVWLYDGIIINAHGISLKAEHHSEKLLVPFNEHFKL